MGSCSCCGYCCCLFVCLFVYHPEACLFSFRSLFISFPLELTLWRRRYASTIRVARASQDMFMQKYPAFSFVPLAIINRKIRKHFVTSKICFATLPRFSLVVSIDSVLVGDAQIKNSDVQFVFEEFTIRLCVNKRVASYCCSKANTAVGTTNYRVAPNTPLLHVMFAPDSYPASA